MSQAVAVIHFSQEDRNLLKKTIAPNTTDDQLSLFIQVCKQTGLNPFARQIYAVIRNEWNKDTRTKEPKMVIQTSIDGYRLLAQRSGEYAGQDGPYWYDEKAKEWVDVWLACSPPAAAKVGVMRQGFSKPIYAVARFESYAVRAYNEQTRKQDGELTNLWKKMPELMIAKVAEALALRRAFPAELSGIYTAEEMAQADAPLTTPHVHVQPATHDESAGVVTGEIVESEPVLTPSKSVLSSQELYNAGKAKGMWKSSQEFFATISHMLSIPVGKDTKLSVEERIALAKQIDDTAENAA